MENGVISQEIVKERIVTQLKGPIRLRRSWIMDRYTLQVVIITNAQFIETLTMV